MDELVRRHYERGVKAGLTWSPVSGGRRSWVCFEDDVTEELGLDATGERFEEIAGRMVGGRHYPVDAVEFFGPFRDEGRELVVGDRVLQRARVFPWWTWPVVWSVVEIFVVEREDGLCRIGYVTTDYHHGRGIWSADLLLGEGRLTLRVVLTACPHSWLFWLGLPYARWIQVRARKRAAEEYRNV